MKTLKIKTCEQIIANKLHDPSAQNERVRECFAAVFAHYDDEDYLNEYSHHKELLSLIYKKRIYRDKSVLWLSTIVNLDYKRMLQMRKAYVLLFVKKYFNVSSTASDQLLWLCKEI
ncbi:MAG: hypothetical protein IJ506_02665 [Clostridia bacterium]|nr:hypothetical protein [Clostridia bacterium]